MLEKRPFEKLRKNKEFGFQGGTNNLEFIDEQTTEITIIYEIRMLIESSQKGTGRWRSRAGGSRKSNPSQSELIGNSVVPASI